MLRKRKPQKRERVLRGKGGGGKRKKQEGRVTKTKCQRGGGMGVQRTSASKYSSTLKELASTNLQRKFCGLSIITGACT